MNAFYLYFCFLDEYILIHPHQKTYRYVAQRPVNIIEDVLARDVLLVTAPREPLKVC